LYIKKAGVTVGAVKGKELIPDHALAVSRLLRENIPTLHVNYDDAVQYLKKKELPFQNLAKGWMVVNYCGINLGWIKVLHNRINNYYPSNWRILKD
jgi:NOL1/NOP2/fmu family ribosome biogenesis protein